jgi:CheY-like chemotaxis protein
MPKTLLLADDSVTIQKVVGISFANEDVVLLTVDNGDDAIRRAREANPDIVLADVVMPGKNGYEVCEAIKGDPQIADTPVLLLTGTFEAFDEDRARRVGADGHITKPFEAQALVDQVNGLLAARSGAPAPAPPPAPAAAEESVSPSADTAYDFFDDEPARESSDAPDAVASPPAPPPVQGGQPEETVLMGSAGEEDAFGFEEGGDLIGDLPREQRPTTPLIPEGTSDFDVDEGATVLLSEAPPPSHEDLDLTPPARDAAASFGMDELDTDGGTDPLAESAARLFEDPGADAPAAHEADAGATRVLSDAVDTSFGDDGSETRILGEPDAEPFASGLGEPTPEPTHASPSVGDDDLVGEVVLDPAGGDAYDVSSSDLGSVFPAAPAPGPAEAPAAEPAPALSPRMREELHDAIEKIAWEAFGQLTEQLVKDAVERVERIAWEVVPQLTEALVKEEIRKLKGE